MGKQWKQWDFIFLGSKILQMVTAAMELKDACSMEKAMTKLDNIVNRRLITLPTKVHIVQAMVFPVVMSGCESWTIKKAEHQRSDTFELWRWRRLLRVPWTARRSKQSILKEINPEYLLEGLILKLKLQYIGHQMPRASWHWKRPDTGKDWRQKKRVAKGEMIRSHLRLNGHEFEQTLEDSER